MTFAEKQELSRSLEEKIALLILLRGFLDAGTDLDGRPFAMPDGSRIRKETILDLVSELSELENKLTGGLMRLYND